LDLQGLNTLALLLAVLPLPAAAWLFKESKRVTFQRLRAEKPELAGAIRWHGGIQAGALVGYFSLIPLEQSALLPTTAAHSLSVVCLVLWFGVGARLKIVHGAYTYLGVLVAGYVVEELPDWKRHVCIGVEISVGIALYIISRAIAGWG